jgi:hypothetical protein
MTAFKLKLAKNALSLALPAVIFVATSHAGASPGAVAPLQLQTIADVPLGGHPTRLDYASLDAGRRDPATRPRVCLRHRYGRSGRDR